MKKRYILLVIALMGFMGNAQIVNIPDANFKAKLLFASATNQVASTLTPDSNGYLSNYTSIDTNNDGEIQVSEALAIKWLDVSLGSIADLTGIQFFTNLQYISCSGNELTSLNISELINLQSLGCSSNQLTSLNISGLINLQSLGCSSNQLASLNISGLTNLQSLGCSYNQLASLQLSNVPNLQFLNCSYNQLPSLNVSGFANLNYLDCSNNQLSSLNLDGLSNLQDLYCGVNQLQTLNVSGLSNLIGLYCGNNQLSSINVDGLINLRYLYCTDNQLPSLNVSELANLKQLGCSYNELPTIDVSGLTNLQSLYCTFNQLTTVDVSGLPNLLSLFCSNNQLNTLLLKNGSYESNLEFYSNPDLQYVCADTNQINQVQNLITQYGYINCQIDSLCTLMVKDFTFSNYFTVYPSPAKNRVTLETKAGILVKTITIYDVLGQIVLAIPNAESVSSIDVSDLKAGTYFIKVNTDKGTANGKFIKE